MQIYIYIGIKYKKLIITFIKEPQSCRTHNMQKITYKSDVTQIPVK